MALRHLSNHSKCILPYMNQISKNVSNNFKTLEGKLLIGNKKFEFVTRRTLTHYPIDNELYGLTPEQVQLRETAFNFFQKEIAPIADKIDKEDDFPGMREFWKKLGELGFLGITADPKYGGSGLGIFEQCLVLEEFSRVSASISLSCGAHSNLCVNQINR